MPGTMSSLALLLVTFVLMAQVCRCTAHSVFSGHGFSVEFIHRDSIKSPFHDPSLTAHERVLAAVRRSTAHAAALSRSYAAGDADVPAPAPSDDGAVSEVFFRSFEYLMYVNVGTPATRMLAIADTGSDLVWVKCTNGTAVAAPQSVLFDPSSSSTFGRVGCESGACHALDGTSCDASSNCKYELTYMDGSETVGLISTETFTFDDASGGCIGCHDRPQLQASNVTFGCSMATTGDFPGDGLVGLGDGNVSLVNQLGAGTSLGRRFSYCLVSLSVNASSVLNFGGRATVIEPGAVTTPLVPSDNAYLTIALESVGIGNSTFSLPQQPHVLVDSGTTLTYLDKGLVDPMAEELIRSIKLPQVQSPDEFLSLCFDVAGVSDAAFAKIVPDVELVLGGGGVVTLKAENMFLKVQEGTMCMALVAVLEEDPLSIIGNIAQQNMHVGFDLDKRTVTFAAAECSSSYAPPPTSV